VNIEPGFRTTTCKECGVEGEVQIVRELSHGRVRVRDFIEHASTCSLFKRAQPRHLRQKRWQKQEARANALVGARETLMSGAVNEDGDGRVFGAWRTESKQTRNPTYRLHQKTWHKLVEGALRNGEEPLLHIRLGQTKTRRPGRYVVIRKEMYEGLRGGPWSPNEQYDPGKTALLKPFSHLVEAKLLQLDPPGAILHERDFELLLEDREETT